MVVWGPETPLHLIPPQSWVPSEKPKALEKVKAKPEVDWGDP